MVISDSVIDRLVDTPNGTLSPAVFSDPGVYEQELEQVFARMWLFVGHESQIPRPGDYVRSRMGEEQVILTRARDGAHLRPAELVPAPGGTSSAGTTRGTRSASSAPSTGGRSTARGRSRRCLPAARSSTPADLRKEEWGMLSARVETFHGTVWATWDDSAPGLIDYFGGAEDYLAPSLMSVDGRDNGTEVLGGVMKWRVGMNWEGADARHGHHPRLDHATAPCADSSASSEGRRASAPARSTTSGSRRGTRPTCGTSRTASRSPWAGIRSRRSGRSTRRCRSTCAPTTRRAGSGSASSRR